MDQDKTDTEKQGILKSNSQKALGRRRGSLYAAVQLPSRPKRPTLPDEAEDDEEFSNPLNAEYFPQDVVQHVLNNVRDTAHKSHALFCQMDTLKKYNDWEWREAARWVKFEEVVEDGGKRWSKPHVASLSMHAILETRKMLLEGSIMLDDDVHDMAEISDSVLDHWVDSDMLDSRLRPRMRDITLKQHKHRHVPRPKSEKELNKKSIALLKSKSQPNLTKSNTQTSFSLHNGYTSRTTLTSTSQTSLTDSHGSSGDLEGLVSQDYKPNSAFMKKIPKDSEVCNIMVGEVDDLDKPVLAFMRLKEARIMEGLSEVKIPTRFVVLIFSPKGGVNVREVGRCIATMMIDEVFREVAYKCRAVDEMVAGLDEFVEQVTVLPPAEWDPKIRIEPPQKVQSQKHRKMSAIQLVAFNHEHGEDDDGGHANDPALQFSKIPFSGLIKDIKRKVPHYWSDYRDCLHIQCFAAFIYVFLGTFTPNVTFGGLLGQATDQYMGVMECILAAAVTGIIFAMFAGQPLNILGSTGPMLVLEGIFYNLCKDNDWEFLPARVWIGLWTAGMILIITIFNLSSLVKYITRFTEESFATLIAVIFIVESFKKMFDIEEEAPVNFKPEDPIPTNCTCLPPSCANATSVMEASTATRNMTEMCANLTAMTMPLEWSALSGNDCLSYFGEPIGAGCFPIDYVPDVFFFSILLFIGTFGVAVALKEFKLSTIFPTFVRSLIGDFAVLISIIIFVVLDILINLPTPKLIVPSEFKPTRDDRGWLISPFSDRNPWWIALAASVPALLCVMLIFLDQQITAVIVNRKENKLKKGVGYHLDMFVLAITITAHSLLGIPWYVAATVSSLAHIMSLKRESECTAPGEKPAFLGVREQRVTALAIGVLSGAAVFITNVLKVIPMPVLYGVFFYMGYSALLGMQFIDRLFLFFQPVKYQPDLPFLRHVQLYRVHIFTLIQVLCLGILWAVKSIKAISIGFPLMVLATGIVRKIIECQFTQYELKWLDDLLPGKHAEHPDEKDEMIGKLSHFDNEIANGSNGIHIISEKKKPVFFVDDENDDFHQRHNTSSTNF